jgi:hypothetical protein
MYLRLKSTNASNEYNLNLTFYATDLAPNVRAKLRKRHLAAFDWICGGPPGAIKFIDLDQLEYCVRLAQSGDVLATLMSNLYLEGLRNLVVPHLGAACQFSIGSRWNCHNQFFTLAGQAIALQAIVVCAPLQRNRELFEIGRSIHRFVTSNALSIGLVDRATSCNETFGPKLQPRVRDNAWYAMALHKFATIYRNQSIQQDAASLWCETMSLYASSLELNPVYPILRLDDKLAAARASTYFGAYSADAEEINCALSILTECAGEYAGERSGYALTARPNATMDHSIDLDCTIGIVRTGLRLLKLRPQAALKSIIDHGTRALFDPKHALSRLPESGVLLVAESLAGLTERKIAVTN